MESQLVPIGLLTGKSTREMILRAATKSAPAQAAMPASCARKTSSWVVVVFLNGSFSELCRKFEAFHNSSWFFLFNSLSGPLGPLILPLQQVPMLQALEKPFCLQPLWRVTKDVRSKRFSSQDYMALTALNSNVASAGTFCTAGAMPRQV